MKQVKTKYKPKEIVEQELEAKIKESKKVIYCVTSRLEIVKAKELIKAIDNFDFTNYTEFVYCGYGEPTCALEKLLESGKYLKSLYPEMKIRLNTNGLGNLYHKKNIIPELSTVVDRVSISLNAPTAKKYQTVTRPQFDNAFEAMLDFASLSNQTFEHTQLSIVDVLPSDEIKQCQQIADKLGIYLKIRHYS